MCRRRRLHRPLPPCVAEELEQELELLQLLQLQRPVLALGQALGQARAAVLPHLPRLAARSRLRVAMCIARVRRRSLTLLWALPQGGMRRRQSKMCEAPRRCLLLLPGHPRSRADASPVALAQVSPQRALLALLLARIGAQLMGAQRMAVQALLRLPPQQVQVAPDSPTVWTRKLRHPALASPAQPAACSDQLLLAFACASDAAHVSWPSIGDGRDNRVSHPAS